MRSKVTNQNWQNEYKSYATALHQAIHPKPSKTAATDQLADQLQTAQATMAAQSQKFQELQNQLLISQQNNAAQQQKLIQFFTSSTENRLLAATADVTGGQRLVEQENDAEM